MVLIYVSEKNEEYMDSITVTRFCIINGLLNDISRDLQTPFNAYMNTLM